LRNDKKSEKTENYKKISVFIDNIARYQINKDDDIVKQSRATEVSKCYQLIVVRSGTLLIGHNGKYSKIRKDEAMLLNKGSEITFNAPGKEECWVISVFFDGEGVLPMLEYLNLTEPEIFRVSGNAIAASLDQLILLFEAGEYFRASIALQTLLLTMKESSSKKYRISDLQDIYIYIQEHYAEPLDLNLLAGVYGTSVSYFSRVFREFFGLAPMTFVNEVRLQEARRLLETTDMKIYEISTRCGFEKMEYFCYVFKKKEGTTPSQYRANRSHIDNFKKI
jgi:AraC-like DNA-binding protein